MKSGSRPRPSNSGSRSRRVQQPNMEINSKARRKSVKQSQMKRQGKDNARVQKTNRARQASQEAQIQAKRTRRVGDVRAEQRAKRQRRQYLVYIGRIAVVVGVILFIIFGSILIYRSDLFHIENVQVNGAEHLTSQEITSIAAISDDSTLLRLDAGGIKGRLEDNAWIQSATIHRVFPDTIVIDITEREPGAVAKINDKSNWVISTDGAWLSAATSEDWENAMKIVDVSPTMSAPISGSMCTDGGILNALEILNSISDDLRSRIVSISAESSIKTSLNLVDGVTVAFGDSSDVELKEEVINSLLDEYAGKISYINVRVPTRPTYRMLEGN